ncbi:MAG: porin family protein [Proteobacteria bacterium]|nr:porin family protein [Pseudomonadota bacterium]
MKKIIAGLLTLLISFAATAQEGPRTYWTLGGALMTFDDGFDSVEPINVFGRLGYDFNANFGIGIEGSFSLIEDDFLGVDYSVTTTFIYLKGSLPIGDDAKLYAMIGPSNVDLTGTLGGFSASADDSDTGFGFGYEKALDTFSISVDYITYFDDFGVDVNAINLGFVTYF